MAQNVETLLSIIQKPPKKRSAGDIDLLASLLDSIKFFKERKLSLKDLHYVAKYLTYVYCEVSKCIIKCFDSGDTFYIIIKGSVSVNIPIKSTNEQGEIRVDFKDVATLDAGKSFGELALITNKPR
jgi:CRP-like cAMP-binding protein